MSAATRLPTNAYRCGSGRVRTRVGHQNHGPRIRRTHGTTNERTISVSSTSPMHEFAKCVVFQRGTSRYVFTTDVSVNEVQTFIRDLVLVMGWFTLLDRYGR
jgi:hypothetical protein